ncbi:melanoma-associated antigen B5-like [Echinops telfairi]|uniref:Melanoma-associated antigen B5-like n=1 Tax=Echinops telfairi TaxID=9371 RepID=A0ABM0J3T2_ECHTE|nr:melanoma-associated antigen B5-like [Echinops telfairi]
MPLHRKCKPKKDEKHQQVQGEAHVRQETSSFSSTPLRDENPQRSAAAKVPHTPQEPQEPFSTIKTSINRVADKGAKRPSRECLHSPNTEDLYLDTLDLRVDILEHFMLYKFKMKQHISKVDMVKIISPRFKDQFHQILKKASERLEVGYAIEVRKSYSIFDSYFLASKLYLPNNGRVYPGRGLPKTGLLMTVLGVILMKGHHATAQEIWEFLSMVRVFPGKKHYIYGEPKRLLTKDLVKLGYLEYRKVLDSEPPCYEFLWGPRALVDSSRAKILEFLAKVNNVAPTPLSSLYEPTEEEKGRRQTHLTAMANAALLAKAFNWLSGRNSPCPI